MPKEELDPAIAAMPAGILFTDATAATAADREEAELESTAAAERVKAQQEAEEQAKFRRLDALASVVADCDPPTAAELGIDTEGMLPARERLVRLAAWERSERDRLGTLTAGRSSFLETIGAPTRTEEQIARLVEADTSNFLSWLRSGAAALTKPQIRAFEKSQLEQRLAGDHHEAQVARAAMAQADEEIAVLERQIEIIASRRRAFAQDVLLEEAQHGAGARYEAARKEMEAALLELLGLAHVVGGHRNYRSTYLDKQEATVRLPAFQLPGLPGYRGGATADLHAPQTPGINISDEQSKGAAKPWRDRLRALSENPRA